MTPSRKASIAFLVRMITTGHIGMMRVEIPVDLSGAFGNNHSLKRLVITDNSGMNGPAITQATLVDIAQMLRVNQGLETLHLDLCQSSNCPEMIRLVARGARGHNSLKNLAITWSDESDESSAEALFHNNALSFPFGCRQLAALETETGYIACFGYGCLDLYR
jgi:hypothetical protein